VPKERTRNDDVLLLLTDVRVRFSAAAWQPPAVSMYSDYCIYLKMMPEMSLRLHPLNEQLIRLWRLEAPQS